MTKRIPKIKVSDLRLVGRRITLRPLRISDAEDIYKNVKDKKILKQTLIDLHPYRFKDAKIFIKKSKKWLRTRTDFVFGIELKETKRLTGVISLHHVSYIHKDAELGYWLGVRNWNRGIMTEAGNLILKFAFRKLKLHRVWAKVFTDNQASQKVLKKLGFKKEGLLRKASWGWGRWHNDLFYGLLNREFKR